MTPANTTRYLETQVLTASREQLLVMLYDGAIRFGEQARESLAAKELERTHDLLVRAQRIVIELWCALNPEVDPELSKSLGGLYAFLYLRLVNANVEHDPVALEEAIQILKSLRQTWMDAVDKSRRGESAADASDTSSLQLTG